VNQFKNILGIFPEDWKVPLTYRRDGEKHDIRVRLRPLHGKRELAEMISQFSGVEVAFLPNPRREASENELNVSREKFLELGLNPTTLSEGLLEEVRDIATRYKDRVDTTKVIARSTWRAGMETSPDLVKG